MALEGCLLLLYATYSDKILPPESGAFVPYFTVNANVVLLNSVWSSLKERSL